MTTPMNSPEHYFATSPHSASAPRSLRVRLAGRERPMTTDHGVFSPQHLDTGTAVLLDAVPAPPTTGELLDVGCGWGPIALSLALASPAARVWAVDVNDRALELTRRNAAENGIENIIACRPEEVPDDVRFDTLWSNPPIRVGKRALHGILETWLPRLRADADAWLVVHRHLGSDSLHSWLTEEFEGRHEVTRITSVRGFRVLRVHRHPHDTLG